VRNVRDALRQQRHMTSNVSTGLQFGMGDQGPHANMMLGDNNVFQTFNACDVDQHLWHGKAQIQNSHQTLPAQPKFARQSRIASKTKKPRRGF